jgi:hypothetical protein
MCARKVQMKTNCTQGLYIYGPSPSKVPFGTALSSWFSGRIRGAVSNTTKSGEVIFGWFWEVILWNELRSWEIKKVASPDSEKWFSALILKNYHRESILVTESLHRRINFSLFQSREYSLWELKFQQRLNSCCNVLLM